MSPSASCRLCGSGGRESAYCYDCGYMTPLSCLCWYIIGIHWPHRISNTALYRRCRCRPISENVKSARWRLFGHVLRMPLDAPAQQAIDYYFADTGVGTFRGRTTLPTALSADLRRVGRTLRRPADIDALRLLNREQWRQLERGIAEES